MTKRLRDHRLTGDERKVTAPVVWRLLTAANAAPQHEAPGGRAGVEVTGGAHYPQMPDLADFLAREGYLRRLEESGPRSTEPGDTYVTTDKGREVASASEKAAAEVVDDLAYRWLATRSPARGRARATDPNERR